MAEARMMEQAKMVRQSGFKVPQTLLSIAAAGLFVAGCSVIPKKPPKTGTPTQPLPSEGLPKDTLRHRIALLVPLTGPNAELGESIANATNMALLDTGGTKFRLTVYDTALGSAADAATKAVGEGNKLILGPVMAEDVRAATIVSRKAKVPLVSFSNDTSVAGKGVYVMGFTPAQSMERIVDYANMQGKKRFAALVPTGVYGERALAAFRMSVEKVGGTFVATESYDRETNAIVGAVDRLGKSGAVDAVMIADSGRVAAQAVPLIRKVSPRVQILGTELWNTDPMVSKVPPLAGAWFASVSDGFYNQLATKYRTRYEKAPYRLASIGYDSILLVTKVSNNWKLGSPFPLTLLEDRGGFTGIDGAFRFTGNGIAERALEVQRITPTGAFIVSPAPKTFAP
jgi:branched-chain amino acid transport system substrate-binding protein